MILMASPLNKTNLPPIFRTIEIAKRAVWVSKLGHLQVEILSKHGVFPQCHFYNKQQL